MKYIINNTDNLMKVDNGKASGKAYYLSRNIITKIKILKLREYLNLNKVIDKCISEYCEDNNMLFHYDIISASKRYLVVYCIKQQLEDKNILSKGDIFPVQFLINKMYAKKSERNCILCIIYKLSSSIYIIYSIKKSIIYSRIIDVKSLEFVEEIVKKDIEMINNELMKKFKYIVISNIENLKESGFVLSYLEDEINAVSI